MPPKVRDMLKRLHEEGWHQTQQAGSHRQLEHASKPGKITVAGHPSDDLAPGTYKSILKQAGLKK